MPTTGSDNVVQGVSRKGRKEYTGQFCASGGAGLCQITHIRLNRFLPAGDRQLYFELASGPSLISDRDMVIRRVLQQAEGELSALGQDPVLVQTSWHASSADCSNLFFFGGGG